MHVKSRGRRALEPPAAVRREGQEHGRGPGSGSRRAERGVWSQHGSALSLGRVPSGPEGKAGPRGAAGTGQRWVSCTADSTTSSTYTVGPRVCEAAGAT